MGITINGYQWQYIAAGAVLYILARITYQVYQPFTTEFQKSHDTNVISQNNEEDQDDILQKGINELVDGSKLLAKQSLLIFDTPSVADTIKKSHDFLNLMNHRISVRSFSEEPIPANVVKNIVETAATVPSYNHSQPWTFVSMTSRILKERLRKLIESTQKDEMVKPIYNLWNPRDNETEAESYTDLNLKEYITSAPVILLVFKQVNKFNKHGIKLNNYLTDESVSLSVGLLLAAIHYSGLVTLVGVPKNLNPAVAKLVDRPTSEELLFILPIGYPSNNCLVSPIKRKCVHEILVEL